MLWPWQWPLRRIIRALWILLTICTLSALPWMIVEFKKNNYSVHYQAWFIAGIFVILAVSATIYEVAMHLEHYNQPKLQIRVIRILWMVPIYAVDSWLSLRFKDARFYIDPLRECYEAYVIYNFFMYLVAYLEDTYGDVNVYYATKPQVEHLWPMNHWLEPWPMGEEFFWACKKGVLSYVIARPLMTAVSVVSNLTGVYGDGEFRADRAYPYVALVNNCAQMAALYCLVLMYNATHAELVPIRPLSKFIVIKAVVFFSYWQSVGLAIGAKLGLIRSAESWSTYDADDVAAGLQNFLICVEMFLAAVMHAHAFPPRDYMDPSRPPPGFLKNIKVMFDVRDVVDDVQGVVTDTVAQTTENIADVGRRTLRTARETSKQLVKPPHALMALFGRHPKRKHGGDDDDSDVESREDRQALLEYSHTHRPYQQQQYGGGGMGRSSSSSGGLHQPPDF